MDWFGEITVAYVSCPCQQIFTVILNVFREGVWIRHYIIPRKTTTITHGSLQTYNIILQNSKVNFHILEFSDAVQVGLQYSMSVRLIIFNHCLKEMLITAIRSIMLKLY